ncbi:hypothetical protein K439DRAFT_1610348 [Ramaria rubella]|nr:hypothetical protein K439DRAFT_1610348 [Ramaria rubella]
MHRFSLCLRAQDPEYAQSYKDELFAPCLAMQARSPNLVFYYHAEGAVVEYPYPMSGGCFIDPAGISKYLERRRQAFECCPVSLDEKYETTSMTVAYPSFDKHSATMPASSPMSGFAAHGLAPQPRRQTGRRHCSTLGYLATVITPDSNSPISEITYQSLYALIKPPFDLQVGL